MSNQGPLYLTFQSIIKMVKEAYSTLIGVSESPRIINTPLNSKLSNLKKRKNFASRDSGATILDSQGVINAKSILSKTNDEYLIMQQCNSRVNNSLVIHLSEDVTVDSILASNHEDFSVNLKEIQFYGSNDYPPKNDKWINLRSIFQL